MSDLDSVIINLKACLVSIKGGIPLNQLESKLSLVLEHLYIIKFELCVM